MEITLSFNVDRPFYHNRARSQKGPIYNGAIL